MLPIICPLVGAGVADHPSKASLAAFIASLTSALLDRGNSPRMSFIIAGLTLENVSPEVDNLSCPLIMLYPLILGKE